MPAVNPRCSVVDISLKYNILEECQMRKRFSSLEKMRTVPMRSVTCGKNQVCQRTVGLVKETMVYIQAAKPTMNRPNIMQPMVTEVAQMMAPTIIVLYSVHCI
jgi:hypothetical protein